MVISHLQNLCYILKNSYIHWSTERKIKITFIVDVLSFGTIHLIAKAVTVFIYFNKKL